MCSPAIDVASLVRVRVHFMFNQTNRENDIGLLFVFQDDHEVDRNEGLKFARKHSMLFIGKYPC